MATAGSVHRGRVRRGRASALTAVLALLAGTLIGWLPVSPARADLASPVTVTTTVSSNPVPPGGQLTYVIDIVNTGGARADEVVFTDQVAGMTGLILTSTVGSCNQSAELVNCNAGSLEGFQAWRVTIRGTVTAAAGTTLHNTASVSGTRSSQTFSTSSTVSTLVGPAPAGARPDLTLSIAAPTPIAPESVQTFDLTVNNIGSVNATDITVVNTLPAGFDYITASAAPSSLFSCSEAFDQITCVGGAVNAGANATITIKATAAAIPSPPSGPPYYDDTAAVDPYNTIDESNELNNYASHRTSVQVPAPPAQTLTITKTGPADPVRPGDLLTYTIKGTNSSSQRADSIRITDGTQGLDAASVQATTTHGSCTVSASEVICTQTSPTLRLQAGETMTVTITGRVVASPGSLIRNVATITGNIKNKGHTSTAAATTSVRPGKDFTITQRAKPNHDDSVVPGPGSHMRDFRGFDEYEYHLTVGNSGLDTATGVVVREPLPAGVTFLGFAAPDFAGGCAVEPVGSNVVVCKNGTIGGKTLAFPGGQTVPIVLRVAAPNAIGVISSTATVDPANAIFEGDETNNTVSTSVDVKTGIDLTVMKAVNFNPVAPSGTLIYTITVTNVGTQDTSGIMVRDTLPAGVRFREAVADPTHNFTCSHDGSSTGGTVDCVGGILRGTKWHTLAPDSATITITLFAPSQPSFIKNQVRVDPLSQIPEIDETNNINTFTSEVAIPLLPHENGAYHSFTITKEHTPEPVAPAGSLTYTINVFNHGSDVAFGVDVRDFLPAGSEFRSAVDTDPGPGSFACTHSNGVVDCVDGTLDGSSNQTQDMNPPPGDQLRTIKIEVFAPRQPGTYSNQAIVDPGNELPEANETDNYATDNTKVAINGGGVYRELSLTKTQVSPAGNVVPDGVLEWELEAKNTGSDAAFQVEVRDVLPTGSRFRFASDISPPGTGAFTCAHDGAATGGVIRCTGGALDGTQDQIPGAGNDTRKIKIGVFAPSQTGTYTNHAFIDPDDTIAEANETNNEASASFTVALGGGGNYIDLVLTKEGPNEVEPLAIATYTLKVKNTGTADAFNVKVRDNLPGNSAFVSARDTGTAEGAFSCGQANGVVTCTGGYLKPGGVERTIEVKVQAPNDSSRTVPTTTTVEMVNQATIDPDNEIGEASEINNFGTKTTKVQSKVDLQPQLSLGSVGSSGTNGSMTFGVQASGASGADNVVVVADLPVGIIPLDVQAPAGWSCQITENPINQVTCTTAHLAAGGSATFTVRTYTTAESGNVNATAHVDPSNTVAETDETNNSKTESKGV